MSLKGIVFVNVQEATLKQLDDIQKKVLEQLGNPKGVSVVVTPGTAYFQELDSAYAQQETKNVPAA